LASGSPYLPLLLAVAFVSCGSVFVRLAEAPALAVAFYRIALASALLAPFAWRAAREDWTRLSRRHVWVMIGSGIALGLHFATWIASLSFTSVAASVLLVNTTPLFTTALAALFLRERPPRAVLAAIGVALAGAVLIAYGDWTTGPRPLAGDLLALAGAVALSVYHVIGRGLRDALRLRAYVLGVWSTAALALAALAAAGGTSLGGYTVRTWLAFLALAVVPTLGGHGLVNRSLRVLPAPTVGLFLLGEPVGATLLAWLVLNEVPGPFTLVGGAVVLAALGLALRAGHSASG
jgi:drug/metabolite transporter (DMT)-like permease